MARKRVPKMPAVQDERVTKPIRLDMSISDYERLERCARERGLTKASYARQAVLSQVRRDEAEGGGK
jgi:predicted DNA-binding protein